MAPRLGIDHPDVIDLVTQDPRTGEWRLIVVEKGDWDGSHGRLLKLQDKLNRYMTFALDGEMEKRYPDSEGNKLIIRLDLYRRPDVKTVATIEALKAAIEAEGIGFELHVEVDPAA